MIAKERRPDIKSVGTFMINRTFAYTINFIRQMPLIIRWLNRDHQCDARHNLHILKNLYAVRSFDSYRGGV